MVLSKLDPLTIKFFLIQKATEKKKTKTPHLIARGNNWLKFFLFKEEKVSNKFKRSLAITSTPLSKTSSKQCMDIKCIPKTNSPKLMMAEVWQNLKPFLYKIQEQFNNYCLEDQSKYQAQISSNLSTWQQVWKCITPKVGSTFKDLSILLPLSTQRNADTKTDIDSGIDIDGG